MTDSSIKARVKPLPQEQVAKRIAALMTRLAREAAAPTKSGARIKATQRALGEYTGAAVAETIVAVCVSAHYRCTVCARIHPAAETTNGRCLHCELARRDLLSN